MTIGNLKDLKQLIKACRDGGVASIELDGVKLTLLPNAPGKARVIKALDFSSDFPEASIPVPKYTPLTNETIEQEMAKVSTDELSQEQLLFYSSVGPTDHEIGKQ